MWIGTCYSYWHLRESRISCNTEVSTCLQGVISICIEVGRPLTCFWWHHLSLDVTLDHIWGEQVLRTKMTLSFSVSDNDWHHRMPEAPDFPPSWTTPLYCSQHKPDLAFVRVFFSSQWQESQYISGFKLRLLKMRCDIYLQRHLACLGREDTTQGQERNEIHYFTIWLTLGIWSEATLQTKRKSAWWSTWSNSVEKVLQGQVLYLSFLASTFIWDH